MADIPPERIQKVLARAGLGSRREIDDWIAAGRVQINGRKASPGDRMSSGDRIKLDGRPINAEERLPEKRRVLAYYKPAGEICTRSDPEGRATVFDRLPRLHRGRWVNIGRLDLNTTGLLLFTNDGELANALMHPSRRVERAYAVRVRGEVSLQHLERLSKGVELDDGPARFLQITHQGGEGTNHWYHVVLAEGRRHEVRRLWESQGLEVSRLIRIRFGPCELPRGRRTGDIWDLEAREVNALAKAAGLATRAA